MIDRLEVERSAARGSQGKDIVPPESGPYFIADARQIGRGDGTRPLRPRETSGR